MRHSMLALFAAIALPAAAQPPDLSKHFAGITGTFVLLDGNTGNYTRVNPERAAARFAPCSTFKIPNTAIALETGAAPDSEYVVRYDPALKLEGQGPDGSWARDHTLRSAFKNSVVWYYQAMARRVGAERMARLVHQFGYGNEDISGGVDTFWLASSLTISADEQVRFLKRFYENGVGLSDRTTTLAKDVFVADETPRWRLSAKTGACRPDSGGDASIWYVGYVEKGGHVYYFALQMGEKTYGEAFDQRVTKARAILRDLGVLD